MRTKPRTVVVGLAFLALIAASCGDGDSSDATAGARRVDRPPATAAPATDAPSRIDERPAQTRTPRPAAPTYAEGDVRIAPPPGNT